MHKDIKEKLNLYKDDKYQQFSSKLLPGISNIIGVKLPILRKIAKEVVKDNPYNYLDNIKNDSFEETMLEGLVIGYLKDDFNKIKKYIKRFVPKIDNWSICDTFCSNLKITNNYKEEMLKILKSYLNSKNEFSIRFCLVMLLNYYVDINYIDKIFKIIDEINNDGYYAKMGKAWLIQVCYLKYKDKTLFYLNNNKLDNWTYNKAIQKIIESLNTTFEEKTILKRMKRK